MVAELYGEDQQLEIELTIVKPRVEFGTSDNNIELTGTIEIGIKKFGEYNNIFYDTMDFFMAMDTEIIQEVWYANVKQMEFTFGGSYIRQQPLYDDMDMTETQYAEYKQAIADKTARWQGYFNDVVFAAGIPLPYWQLELDTWV